MKKFDVYTKISEDGTHSLPTLLLAEKCTQSSWCDNREVLLLMTAEVKRHECSYPRDKPECLIGW